MSHWFELNLLLFLVKVFEWLIETHSGDLRGIDKVSYYDWIKSFRRNLS